MNDGSDKSIPIVNEDGSKGVQPFILLGHELFHAYQYKYGNGSKASTGEIDPDRNAVGMTKEEKEARIKENIFRDENQIGPRKLPYLPTFNIRLK